MVFVILLGFSVSPPPTNYICNYAKVVATSRRIAVVHNRPDDRSPVVDRLKHGTVVYICDESRRDDNTDRWSAIRFADPAHACRGSVNGIAVNDTKTCRSGWLRERHVEVLSG